MATMQEIIEFLRNLMFDEEAKAKFEQDPTGTLDDCGLSGITGRDVEDARVIMQDSGLAQSRAGGSTSTGNSDAVEAIRHTTTTYEINRSVDIDYNNQQELTVVEIDDSDTTVNDSFNRGDTHNDVTAIQDNDTINDNDTVNNDVDMTNVEDSFNDETPEPAEEPAGTSDEADTPDDAEAVEAQTLPAMEPEPEPEPEPDPSLSEPDMETVDSAPEAEDALVG